jgi:hypothetical protein
MDTDATGQNISLLQGTILIEVLREKADSWDLQISWRAGANSHIQHASLDMQTLEMGPTASDLQWYFRDRIQMPFLQTARAVEIERRLNQYGVAIFDAIFPPGSTLRSQLADWTEDHNVRSEIRVSGPPEFQKIHWELLQLSTDAEPIGLKVPIVRSSIDSETMQRVTTVSNTNLNILLVTARTRGSRDIDHRIISRVMDDIINREGIHCTMNVLPIGTLSALKHELENKAYGFYHIVHFDTHGLILSANAYKKLLESPDCDFTEKVDIQPDQSEAFIELQGKLIYSSGVRRMTKDLVPAATIAKILDAAGISISILNSCDSASTSSNLIGTLHEHGVPHVVGISFALSEEAAKTLTANLYNCLISGKPLSRAIAHARKELFREKSRSAFFGASLELEDWLLPIFYSNSDFKLDILPPGDVEAVVSTKVTNALEALDVPVPVISSSSGPDGDSGKVHQKYRSILDTHSLLGRSFEILQMQQLLLEERNALLLRGLGGIGKSFLLQHLCYWWTRIGFCDDALYIEYSCRVWSVQQLVGDIGSYLFTGNLEFQTKSFQTQIEIIHQVCHERRLLIVLDNLEAISPAQTLEEPSERKKRRAFRRFLAGICSSKSYLLLGSRAAEGWLSAEVFEDNTLLLGGLDRESASLLIRKLLDLHNRPEYINLASLRTLSNIADRLDRHPLAMQAVMSSIQTSTPERILEAVLTNKLHLEAQEDLDKCLDYSFQNMSSNVREKILQLGPFSTHVILDDLVQYSKHLATLSKRLKPASGKPDNDHDWELALKELQILGLAAPVLEDSSFFILHPHLVSYVLGVLQANMPAEVSLDDCNSALMMSTRDTAYAFLKDVDMKLPSSTYAKQRRGIGFALENYRRALIGEIKLLNEGKSSDIPNIWYLIGEFFDSELQFGEYFEFSQAILQHIDRSSKHSVPLCCMILNSISRLHQDFMDENSALETIKEQLVLISSFPIQVATNQTTGDDETRVQTIEDSDISLAMQKSECYQELGTIASSSYKTSLGINCAMLSMAWHQLTNVYFPERSINCLNLLAQLYFDSQDENLREVFLYAGLQTALIAEDYPGLVVGMILSQELEKFSDEELPFVERVLIAINSTQGHTMAPNDQPSVDMYLLNIAMRQNDGEKVLRFASSALSRLKQIGEDYREFELYKRLASWYEGRKDILEARDCWLKGFESVKAKKDLGEVVRQKLALENLVRLERTLGNPVLQSKYETALKSIHIVVSSATEVTWGKHQPQATSISEQTDQKSSLSEPDERSDIELWKAIETIVDADLHLLKPTVDQFISETKGDAKLFSDIMGDRKDFLKSLAEDLEE